MTEPRDNAERTEASRSAGRGVVLITGAKVYFIVTGYAVQLALPRLLGSADVFGLYSSAMSLVSILNNTLVTATIQTVSKRVSETADNKALALRQGLSAQLGVGTLLGAAFLLGAPGLSALKGDVRATALFRVAALVLFTYSLYAALVGGLNGSKRFAHQAGLDLTYTTLRTAGILGAAALGYGAVGAFSGFAAASLGVLLTAFVLVGPGRAGRFLPWRSWFSFMAPLVGYHLCLNLILQFDLFLVTSNVTHMRLAAGDGPELASQVGNSFAGYYRAAQTFAFVPYQLILSVAFVVFPMVSEAVAVGDAAATRSYIRAALRFSLIVLFAIAAPVAGASDGVMRIAYPQEYLAGSSALSVLALGMVCFALFAVAATILSGAGRPGLSAGIAAVTVLLITALNLVLVRLAGVGELTLPAAAAATSLGTLLALALTGLSVHRLLGAFIAPRTALRVLVAAAVSAAVAHAVPHGDRVGALLSLVVGGIAYLLALGVLREVGRDDLERVLLIAWGGARRHGPTPGK